MSSSSLRELSSFGNFTFPALKAEVNGLLRASLNILKARRESKVGISIGMREGAAGRGNVVMV